MKPLGRLTVLTAYNCRLRREKGTKTGTTRTVPVHPTLAKLLAGWRLAGFERVGHKPKLDDYIIPAKEGGLLRWVTHAPADMFDAYTTTPWPALCEAVACLRVELREGRVVPLRPAVLGDAGETLEAEPESDSEVV